MKKLVENSEMGIPYTTLLNKMVVKIARSLLGINRLNALYAKTGDRERVDFAQAILDELGVKILCDEKRRIEAIPEHGPFIVVANHPHGALDGLLLLVLVASVRPDVKFFGNFLLSRIEELKDFFLPAGSFSGKGQSNIAEVRQARTHLDKGSPLILFPAGEVSTYQKGFGKVEDRIWSDPVVKFIKRSGVPVVPVYIGGRNSLKYHLLGKIHPLLQSARLPLELINKEGKSVSVAFGTPVSATRLDGLDSVRAASDFLRANVYCLKAMLADEEQRIGRVKLLSGGKRQMQLPETGVSVAGQPPAPNRSLLQGELEGVSVLRRVSQVGELQLYVSPASDIPLVIHEINRLKNEQAWNGEGGGENLDAGDRLGEYLIVWDSERQELVAAYRLANGEQILSSKGFEGFDSYLHFEFSKGINEVLRHSLELGQCYIRYGHSRLTQAMLLIWQEFLRKWLTGSDARYLISTIELTGGYSTPSKRLLVDFIQANYWNDNLARYVLPRHGVGALGKSLADETLLRGIRTGEEIDKLLRDIEPSGQGMPVLMKKYLQWGGEVTGFNLDPEKSNALDIMLVLDLKSVPQTRVGRMIKQFPGVDIPERFRSAGNPAESDQV